MFPHSTPFASLWVTLGSEAIPSCPYLEVAFKRQAICPFPVVFPNSPNLHQLVLSSDMRAEATEPVISTKYYQFSPS